MSGVRYTYMCHSVKIEYMKYYDIEYKVEMYSDWHCGSGLAAGASADAVVVKDESGLPYIPGRTLKGLLSEAIDFICGKKDSMPSGMFFSDAVLHEDLKARIVSESLSAFMYRNVSSVMINGSGVSEEGSLRTIEVTAPCILYARMLNVPEDRLDDVKAALKYVKRLGYHRHRGMGRCGLSFVSEVERSEVKLGPQSSGTLYFRCRLLSDVVLSQTSATSGPQTTLDFIPGSCFWGIVANGLYNEGSALIYDILYSGKVRFGDAHPSYGNIRGLRIPASFFYPKDTDVFRPEGEKSEVYVHHKIMEMPKEVQLKQCRSGFVVVEDDSVIRKVETYTDVSVKTAWDRASRSAKKSQLFTYESLRKGLEMLFSVEVVADDTSIADQIVRHLAGRRNVGRSRSAQYGLVEITQICEDQYVAAESDLDPSDDGLYAVYADSRLIFLDEMGLPHFRPRAEDLGFSSGATILWDKSQVRTFGYSSFNAYRKSHNSDYIGIEKGSVFVVSSKEPPHGDGWTGSFRTEGFGHVLYNPSFLKATGVNGISNFRFVIGCDCASFSAETSLNESEQTLLEWLVSAKKEEDVMSELFSASNSMRDYFNSAVSISQWGQIRQIAMAGGSYDQVKITIKEFISKGVSSKYWQGKSGNALKTFLETTVPALCHSVDIDRFGPMAVANLASVMMKKAQSGKKNKTR